MAQQFNVNAAKLKVFTSSSIHMRMAILSEPGWRALGSRTGERILMLDIVWLLALSVVLILALVLLSLRHPRVHELFHLHVPDRPKRRLFLAAVGFFLAIAVARLAAFAAGRNFGPFHYIYIRGTHVHHLVWGILLLLIVGFCWLIEVGTGARSSSLFASRLMSLLYGIGAALTLDEFTFWLNLDPDSYWNHEGRASIEAVLLFGFALLIGIWGRTFWKALSREFFPRPRRKRATRE